MANHNSILEVTTKNLQYNYKKLSMLANKSICALLNQMHMVLVF